MQHEQLEFERRIGSMLERFERQFGERLSKLDHLLKGLAAMTNDLATINSNLDAITNRIADDVSAIGADFAAALNAINRAGNTGSPVPDGILTGLSASLDKLSQLEQNLRGMGAANTFPDATTPAPTNVTMPSQLGNNTSAGPVVGSNPDGSIPAGSTGSTGSSFGTGSTSASDGSSSTDASSASTPSDPGAVPSGSRT